MNKPLISVSIIICCRCFVKSACCISFLLERKTFHGSSLIFSLCITSSSKVNHIFYLHNSFGFWINFIIDFGFGLIYFYFIFIFIQLNIFCVCIFAFLFFYSMAGSPHS